MASLSLTCCVFIALAFCLTATRGHRHGRVFQKIVKRQVSSCDENARFRQIDGQCNNLNNPQWGSASIVMDRLAPSAYGDGVSSPRTLSVTNSPLPSAREVSLKCHPPREARADVTLIVMQWGQFTDHDITLTPHVEGLECPCDSASSDCFAIPLSSDEYFQTRDCLEVVRSAGILASDKFGSTPVRQQANALTAYIDASMVYGSSQEELDTLRGSGGKMRDSSGGFLPEGSNSSCRAQAGEFCFLAGDVRVNEQPGLAAMHTIFVREHNRIASIFQSRTSWDDERIFQETRKIIGAIMQRITYGEFLPLVLGPQAMKDFGLEISSRFNYDANVAADITNSFATAAYRFGHSLIPDLIETRSAELIFSDLFFSPTVVLSSMPDLIHGMRLERSMAADRNFVHSVTRHLFQTEDQDGSDLVSLNIQRGRDHGLPSYNEFRKVCNMSALTSLSQLFPDDPVAASAYSSIDDVDLFTGGMSEPLVDNGLVGPTFACILGIQFQRLRNGDRFFYLNEDGPQRFSRQQKDEINKMTLSKIICENSENTSIQENVFLPTSGRSGNPNKDCRDIPDMNFDAWTGRDSRDGRGGRNGSRG